MALLRHTQIITTTVKALLNREDGKRVTGEITIVGSKLSNCYCVRVMPSVTWGLMRLENYTSNKKEASLAGSVVS